MGNLTITVDDDSLRKARIRALQEGTSVNSLLRDFLEAYAGVREEQQNAAEKIAALSQKAASRRGQKKWTRDELHGRS